jgi:mono/diheme cytochrome c family protein
MKRISIVFAAVTAIFAGCEALNNYPPPVTPGMAKTGKHSSGAAMEQLEHGRRLYAGRCLECHVLPAITHYPAEKWPRIVDWMGERAALKPAEREAIVAYVLAAHAQMQNAGGK